MLLSKLWTLNPSRLKSRFREEACLCLGAEGLLGHFRLYCPKRSMIRGPVGVNLKGAGLPGCRVAGFRGLGFRARG